MSWSVSCYLPSLTLQQHKRCSALFFFFLFRSRVIWRAIYRAVAEHRAWCCCCCCCCSSYLSLPLTAPALVSPSLFPLCFLPAVILFFFFFWAPLRLVSSSQVFPRFHVFFFRLFFHSLFDVNYWSAQKGGDCLHSCKPRLLDWMRLPSTWFWLAQTRRAFCMMVQRERKHKHM